MFVAHADAGLEVPGAVVRQGTRNGASPLLSTASEEQETHD